METGSLLGVAAAARRLEDEVRAYLAAAPHSDLAEQAQVAWRAGRVPEAAALAEQALAGIPGREARARLHLLLARCELMLGRSRAACERLRTEAAVIADSSPELAATLLCEASRAAFAGGDGEAAFVTARHADELAAAGPDDVRRDTTLAVALAGLQSGTDSAEALMEETLAGLADAPADLFGTIHRWSSALLWAERHEDVQRVLQRVVERSRALRLLEFLPIALDTLAAVEFRTGRWQAAEAHASEALRLNRSRAAPFEAASNLTTLARIDAARGDENGTRARLRAAHALDRSEGLILGYSASAAALLELSLGRAARAAAELERIASTSAARFEPTVFRWEADYVEALVRAGRTTDAQDACDRFAARASASTRSWTRAALHRCRGLLAGADVFDVEFAEALRWHRRSSMPFERARTELCYAERLRRAHRGAEARTWFSSALATFEQLGADPWTLRARRGVAGPGRHVREPHSGAALSPHERQVAALVQRGATNREVAAALFVTPKTVEYHLAAIYRKFGLRSRTELSYVLSTAPARGAGGGE